MAVTTTYSPLRDVGNGVTVNFACSWPVFGATDILVSIFDTSLNSLISPQPVLNGAGTYDYTVTLGSQDQVTLEYASATVVMNNAPPGNYRVIRQRVTAMTQPNSYQENTKFPAASVGQSGDRAVMGLQQVAALASLLCLQFPATDAGSLNNVLPPAALRLDKLVVCDPTTGAITVSAQTLTSIAAPSVAAAAAAVSAASAASSASLAAGQVALASVQVGLAASQVSLASVQVGLAASQVTLASVQVGLAASQVALASGQASIATAQATIATAQASLAQAAVGGVKASASDTTAAPLLSKLVAGSAVTLTKNNPGGNETVTVAVSLASYLNASQTNQTISGGASITAFSLGTISSGSLTVDVGKCPQQYVTNNGAHTLVAPAADGNCLLTYTNGASAGAITPSGWSNPSSTGDALTTTNGNKFTLSIWRNNGIAGYRVAAHQ